MSELSMLVTITTRNLTKKFVAFYEEMDMPVSVITLGSGTASSEILDYFGLAGSDKSVIFHIITDTKWKEVKRQLRLKMNIDIPGIGISFLIPLSSIGGTKALNYLTARQEYVKGEESSLKDTKYELLVTIANQGHTELIMDAARKVHAAGGEEAGKGNDLHCGAQESEKRHHARHYGRGGHRNQGRRHCLLPARDRHRRYADDGRNRRRMTLKALPHSAAGLFCAFPAGSSTEKVGRAGRWEEVKMQL